MAEAETEEDKKPRVYVGDMVKVKDLPPGAIVQALPETRKAHKLPLFMVVSEVVPFDTTRVLLVAKNPRDGFRPVNTYVSKKAELNVLTGRMGRELAAEHAKYRKDNLWLYVAAPGMTLGTDPEVFVTLGKGEEETIIPAFEFLPPKKKPLKLTGYGAEGYKNTTVYWDGFQAEFTTDPGTCLAYQTDAVRRSLKLLYDAVKAHNKKARLSIRSVLPVPGDQLITASDEHVEFGCMPSLNVYGMEGHKTPGRHVPIRFAGGHLHLGLGTTSQFPDKKIQDAVRGLDKVLGVACVSLFEGYDTDIRRRYYGLAGEYRRPAHGLEYRTLSNAWLIHPTVMNVVFEVARCAVGFGLSGMMDEWNSPEEETIEAINNNDVELARKIMERNKATFIAITNQRGLVNSAATVYKFMYEGMRGRLKHPDDLATNWGLQSADWIPHGGGNGRNWITTAGSLAASKSFKLE